MKKQFKKIAGVALAAACLTLGIGQSAEAKDVSVTLPSFPVSLNGISMDQANSQYPLLVYKDITYVPMTYYDARLLGLTTVWTDASGLSVKTANSVPDTKTAQAQYKPYTAQTKNKNTYTATIASFAVSVQGNRIDNSKEEYPLLVFRDVTYFPLTWRFAVDHFGWKYHFDAASGLVIAPVPTPTIDPYPAIITGTVVNVRAESTTASGIITQVKQGDNVLVTNEETNSDNEKWCAVTLSNNTKGYIASWLLKKDTATPSTPSEGGTTSAETKPVVLNQTLYDGMQQTEKETTLRFWIGKENDVSASQNSANQVRIVLNNNDAGAIAPIEPGSGPLLNAYISTTGTQSILNLTMQDGAYCFMKNEDGLLSVTVRARGNQSGTLAGKVIVIDPGHGSNYTSGVDDPGAIGRVLGFTDKQVGTTIGYQLKSLLEANGATVYMTRGEQVTSINLYDRANLANDLKADLFISLHGNALENNTVKSGIEVYYYTGTAKPTPSAQSYIRKEFASDVANALGGITGRSSVTKTDNFVVIRETDCPSILVECGYLSNAEEEALLASEEYQMLMAQGILNGITAYFAQ